MKNHLERLFNTVTDEYKRASENIPIADAFLGPIMHGILSTNNPSVSEQPFHVQLQQQHRCQWLLLLHQSIGNRLKKMQSMQGICNLCIKLIQTTSLMLIVRQWVKESQLPSQTLQSILWIVILELHHLPLAKSTIQSTLT
jgi:hypothetical protein